MKFGSKYSRIHKQTLNLKMSLRCDMAFFEPMHRNKPNITYLLKDVIGKMVAIWSQYIAKQDIWCIIDWLKNEFICCQILMAIFETVCILILYWYNVNTAIFAKKWVSSESRVYVDIFQCAVDPVLEGSSLHVRICTVSVMNFEFCFLKFVDTWKRGFHQ